MSHVATALSTSAFPRHHPLVAPTTGTTIGPVWGYVVTTDHKCVEGADVEIVDSSAPWLVGQKSHQNTCNFDDGIGYSFTTFAPTGTRFTLRASRDGYPPQTVNTVGSNPAPPVNIVLVRD